jgi:hypothetical protein
MLHGRFTSVPRSKEKVVGGNDEPGNDNQANPEHSRQKGVVDMKELHCSGSECHCNKQLEQQ